MLPASLGVAVTLKISAGELFPSGATQLSVGITAPWVPHPRPRAAGALVLGRG